MSAHLSAKRVNCGKTKETSAKILVLYKMFVHLVFWKEELLVGEGRPFYLKFCAKLTPSLQKRQHR